MTELLLWGSLAVIVLLMAIAVVVGRRQMRAPRWRVSDPALVEIAAELKKTNALLQTIAEDHEKRLDRLEQSGPKEHGINGDG